MVDQPIAVREATPADAGVVATLLSALLTELGSTTAPGRDAMVGTAGRVVADRRVLGLLASADGPPIGVMMLSESVAYYAGGAFATITELYVEPPYRSRKVAAALLDAAVSRGRARGWQRLEVGAPTQPAWARSLAFYERNGFEEIGPRLLLML